MRRGGLVLFIVLAAGLGTAAPAGAATINLGQVAPPGTTGGACSTCTYFQGESAPVAPYTVPAGSWTITSWRAMSGTATVGNRLVIYRPDGAVYRLAAQSAEESVVGTPGGAERSFTTSIPVQGGDRLGVRTGIAPGDISVAYPSANVADVIWAVIGDPAIGQSVGPGGDHPVGTASQFRVNVAVTAVEVIPDSGTPDTTITSGPGKKTAQGKATFRFTSSQPNSTFVCKIDKKPFRPCTSPAKYKKLAPGKHKFRVQAINASGNADPTPAVKKFKVPR